MQKIQCPDVMGKILPTEISFFVAGGITNCPEWQDELISSLEDVDKLILINPRRSYFDVNDPNMEEDQIKWEHDHINRADGMLFWFPCETLCPITWFELGVVCGRDSGKPIFVGTHPKYQRVRDVRWQMLLLRPEIDVVHSIEALAEQVRSRFCLDISIRSGILRT